MKLSNKVVLNCVGVLSKLNGLELPVKVAFLIRKNIVEVEKELAIYNASRQSLIEQYTQKDEDGHPKVDEFNNYQFKEECLEKWCSDIEELLNIEIEVNIHQVSITDLLTSNIVITPSELASIEFLFVD